MQTKIETSKDLFSNVYFLFSEQDGIIRKSEKDERIKYSWTGGNNTEYKVEMFKDMDEYKFSAKTLAGKLEINLENNELQFVLNELIKIIEEEPPPYGECGMGTDIYK